MASAKPNLLYEGSILKLRNPAGKFIGKGYVGKQNKGIGWLLTKNENETIDTAFFQKKIPMQLNTAKIIIISRYDCFSCI